MKRERCVRQQKTSASPFSDSLALFLSFFSLLSLFLNNQREGLDEELQYQAFLLRGIFPSNVLPLVASADVILFPSQLFFLLPCFHFPNWWPPH